MLGRERQSLREVAIEVGGLLARDPVDEIERDVVERGITKSMNGPPDVVRTGNALEHLEQPGCERLRPDRDSRVTPPSRSNAASAGVTVSGFASTVTSAAAGSAANTRRSASGSVNDGVPPPMNTVATDSASTPRSRSSSSSSAST